MEISTKRKPDETGSVAVVPSWLMSYMTVWVESL